MAKNPRARSYIVACLVFLLLLFSLFHYRPSALGARPSSTMSVTHTVLFQFKQEAEPKRVKEVCESFLALKTKCIHPLTQAPYVLSVKGGKDNSPEGLQHGITHGFVVEFASLEDRDFYVEHDPAHKAFKDLLPSLVEEAIVVDFVNEEF